MSIPIMKLNSHVSASLLSLEDAPCFIVLHHDIGTDTRHIWCSKAGHVHDPCWGAVGLRLTVQINPWGCTIVPGYGGRERIE